MDLHGRVALVTGAAGSGFGRSIALTLARAGARVAVNYRRHEAEAQRVAALATELGGEGLAVAGDVTDPKAAAALVQSVVDRFGQLDILVNNAGGPWRPRDLPEIPPAHWRRVLAAEVDSVFYLLRAALPLMRQRRWGRIITIGGYLADDWPFGPPQAPLDYPLGKAARHWLTRALARQELGHGVTVNAVAPGPVDHISLEEAVEFVRHAPAWLSRPAPTPQDVAEAVLYLASEEARYVTGTVLQLHGPRAI